MNVNPYVALALNGFFTGLGVVAASHVYEQYIKPRVMKAGSKINSIKQQLNNSEVK